MGRKRLGRLPSVALSFRVTKDMACGIQSWAKVEGLTVSAWIAAEMPSAMRRARQRLREGKIRLPDTPDPPPPSAAPPPPDPPPPPASSATPPVGGTGSPENPYGACPCGSGLKWKFCRKLGRCGS